MKTIIAGGRHYVLSEEDLRRLDKLRTELPITEVVCGMASGADSDGRAWAVASGIRVREFPANWGKFGNAAGPMRNQEMAAYADALIAFSGGSGTADMVRKATNAGLKIIDLRREK